MFHKPEQENEFLPDILKELSPRVRMRVGFRIYFFSSLERNCVWRFWVLVEEYNELSHFSLCRQITLLFIGCSDHFGVHVLKSFCYKRAQVILVCACSFVCSNHFAVRVLKSFVMRVLKSFWYVGARIILIWYAGARVILVCGCSNHFGMRVLELFWYAGARVILVRGC